MHMCTSPALQVPSRWGSSMRANACVRAAAELHPRLGTAPSATPGMARVPANCATLRRALHANMTPMTVVAVWLVVLGAGGTEPAEKIRKGRVR